MDYDLILKISTLCFGLVGAAKILYDLLIGRRSRLRDEYKFAREFLEDVKLKIDLHPYLRDKGYQAIAGDNQINGEEVEYLLSLTRPERALRDYVMGRQYLEHLPQSGNLQIKFKRKYESKWSRQWRMYGYLFAYIVTAFAAFAPLIFSSYMHLSLPNTIAAFAMSLSVFGPYALLTIRAGAKIYRAQMLVSHQDRHTQKILLSESTQKRMTVADKVGH